MRYFVSPTRRAPVHVRADASLPVPNPYHGASPGMPPRPDRPARQAKTSWTHAGQTTSAEAVVCSPCSCALGEIHTSARHAGSTSVQVRGMMAPRSAALSRVWTRSRLLCSGALALCSGARACAGSRDRMCAQRVSQVMRRAARCGPTLTYACGSGSERIRASRGSHIGRDMACSRVCALAHGVRGRRQAYPEAQLGGAAQDDMPRTHTLGRATVSVRSLYSPCACASHSFWTLLACLGAPSTPKS